MLCLLNNHDISDFFGCKLAKVSTPFDTVHSNVCDLSPVSSKGESTYFLSFIDDYTYYMWVYLIKHMYDLFNIYIDFRAQVNTLYFVVIKCFGCDFGGEHTSNDFT